MPQKRRGEWYERDLPPDLVNEIRRKVAEDFGDEQRFEVERRCLMVYLGIHGRPPNGRRYFRMPEVWSAYRTFPDAVHRLLKLLRYAEEVLDEIRRERGHGSSL